MGTFIGISKASSNPDNFRVSADGTQLLYNSANTITGITGTLSVNGSSRTLTHISSGVASISGAPVDITQTNLTVLISSIVFSTNVLNLSTLAPINVEMTDYVSRVNTAGGTISSPEQAAINTLITSLKTNNFWDNADIGLFMGGFASAFVKLRCHSSSTLTATNIGHVSSDYSSLGVKGNGTPSKKTDIGVNANVFAKNNVTIGTYRIEIFSGVQGIGGASNNICGTPEVWTGLGFTRNNYEKGGVRVLDFLDSGSQLLFGNGSGFISGSGGSTVTHYRNGNGLSSKAGLSGFFNSNPLYFPNSDFASYGGWYVLPRALSSAEHRILANIWNTFQVAIGRTFVDISNNTLFIGDSLTYGFAPNFAQVETPYFTTLLELLSSDNAFMLGVSGQAARDILANINQYTLRYYSGLTASANRIYLFIGTNDLGNYVDSASFLMANIVSICTALKAVGYKIYIATLIPSTSYSSFISVANYNSQAPIFNAALVGDARFSNGVLADGIARMDLQANLQDPNNTTYFQDGIHPTSTGYVSVASAFYTAVTGANLAPLKNAGFESETPNTYNGAFTYRFNTIAPTGFTGTGTTGSIKQDSKTLYPSGIPNGQVLAYIANGGTLTQSGLGSILANTVYTFNAYVGKRSDIIQNLSYSIRLMAGSTVMAEVGTPIPSSGTFVLSTVSFDTGINNAFNGQSLGIQLVANSTEVNFDALLVTYVTY